MILLDALGKQMHVVEAQLVVLWLGGVPCACRETFLKHNIVMIWMCLGAFVWWVHWGGGS